MTESTRQLKENLRVSLITQRRARTATELRDADNAIAHHAGSWHALSKAQRVACYLSLPGEPGTKALLELLSERGIEVIVPISNKDRSMDWAVYDGQTQPGILGIREPTGPPLGKDALESCQIAFIPALAVDHSGRRLGRGAGYYDRALVDFTGITCAIVFEDELREKVPYESHDRPVNVALTPGGVFRVL